MAEAGRDFLLFDDETEELCKELGIEVWFPKAKCARWRQQDGDGAIGTRPASLPSPTRSPRSASMSS